MTDISSLLPPPPPKPSFANRIKIKLEYTDLKAQFYQVVSLKESLLVDLNEKETKQLRLRMECDLILDQIELIRSRLPIEHQKMETEDPEMKRFRKYQENTDGFMYESDDQLINQKNAYEMDQGGDDDEEEEENGEEEEHEHEYEDTREAQVEGEEEEEQGHDEYHHQRMIKQRDFGNQSISLPPAHHQQILHQQPQQQEEEEDDEDEELEEDDDDEEEDEYEDADNQSTPQVYPHLDRPPAPISYPNTNIS